MSALIPVVLLAVLLAAPRRGGRPSSRGARFAAAFVLIAGTIAVLGGSFINHLLGR